MLEKSLAPALLVAALVSTSAFADDEPGWFEIEVIVFLHREDAASVVERWDRDRGYPDVKHAVELLAPTEPRVLQAYERLDPAEMRLTGTMRTLERSARYRPLLHTGWRQPGLSREAALAVRIDDRAGTPLEAVPLRIELPPDPEPLLEPEPEPGFVPMPDERPDDVPDGWPDERSGPPITFVDTGNALEPASLERGDGRRTLLGTVRLVLQRFLHVEVDLVHVSDDTVAPEAGDDLGDDPFGAFLPGRESEVPARQRYRLQESRRISSREMHYFDHPEFGVIALVHRMDPDEVERRRDNHENAFRAALLEREARRLLEMQEGPEGRDQQLDR